MSVGASADSSAGTAASRVLVLACGALAREVIALRSAYSNTSLKDPPNSVLTLQCLPAQLHNRPQHIVPALRAKLAKASDAGFNRVFIGYGDCGTGGDIDRLIAESNRAAEAGRGPWLERLPGAHCYAFYAGLDAFDRLADDEPGSFYLTDFLVAHFHRLVWQGLGIDRHPQLQVLYFGNYRRLVYLAQTKQGPLAERAEAIAVQLGLQYHYAFTGYGELATGLHRVVDHTALTPTERGQL